MSIDLPKNSSAIGSWPVPPTPTRSPRADRTETFTRTKAGHTGTLDTKWFPSILLVVRFSSVESDFGLQHGGSSSLDASLMVLVQTFAPTKLGRLNSGVRTGARTGGDCVRNLASMEIADSTPGTYSLGLSYFG